MSQKDRVVDLVSNLQLDVATTRDTLGANSLSLNTAIAVLKGLSHAAQLRCNLCPSDDGCCICWPDLGIFCEVDKHAITIHLVPYTDIRSTEFFHECPTPSDATGRLDAEFMHCVQSQEDEIIEVNVSEEEGVRARKPRAKKRWINEMDSTFSRHWNDPMTTTRRRDAPSRLIELLNIDELRKQEEEETIYPAIVLEVKPN
jgi:hypothetical protein